MRVTINIRHTGRFYIGMSGEDFATLVLLLRTCEAAQNSLLGIPKEHRPARDRILKAINDFVKKIKAESAI